MLKSELIERLAAEYPNMTMSDVERVVNTILGQMTDSIAKGERVELRGFGIFTVRQRPGRRARNPRTGEPVDIPAKTVPFFKSGKDLRDRLQEGPPLPAHLFVPR